MAFMVHVHVQLQHVKKEIQTKAKISLVVQVRKPASVLKFSEVFGTLQKDWKCHVNLDIIAYPYKNLMKFFTLWQNLQL